MRVEAVTAGIPHSDRYVDATTLEDDDAIQEAVSKYTIFGRVKPEQKKSIVLALKKNGLKVAMTGDGVNDILAMKEADCSIAMGNGSDAARQAAQVVLLDSDFSRMEDIVSRGRQIINNITRSATVFLFKNIFSMLLAIVAIIATFNYPLVPSQISLVTLFNTGVPAFLLSLEPNTRKQKQSFFRRILANAGPAAFTAFFTIAALSVYGKQKEKGRSDGNEGSAFLRRFKYLGTGPRICSADEISLGRPLDEHCAGRIKGTDPCDRGGSLRQNISLRGRTQTGKKGTFDTSGGLGEPKDDRVRSPDARDQRLQEPV